MKHFSVIVGLVFGSALVSCRSSTGPELSSVTGTYALQSVTGRGPADGQLVLYSSGAAERSVQYLLGNGTLGAPYVESGYFTITHQGQVEVGFREGSDYVFKPRTTFQSGVLTLEYGDALDGPNVVETYKRIRTSVQRSVF